MSTARNPVTGDLIKTKPASDSYRDNYDAIFGSKKPPEPDGKAEKKRKKK